MRDAERRITMLSSQLSALSSQLSALSSQLSAGVLLLTCAVIGGGSGVALAQSPPIPIPRYTGITTEFTTHDATTTVSHTPPALFEAWADVKTTGGLVPGSGWTFCVGTIEVSTTDPTDNPTFSDKAVVPPLGAALFQIPGTATFATKQVVVLQARGPDPSVTGPNADQDIRWQRLFYGDSGLWTSTTIGPIGRTATNARAVSVWPVWKEATGELDQVETRIAICGETYDSRLPNNQFNGTGGWNKFYGPIQFQANYPRGLPSGFIAVYRGNGDLLWSHQFFFEDASIPPGGPEGACAITDVSIRVEQVGEVKRDVVTYCGISSFGLRLNETTALTAYRSYAAPTSAVTGYVPGGGATDNSNNGAILDQWDGIVGRISNLHSA
ncbi:MAG: hypothetical protein KDC98_21615, partial [Planctomycetes bacterium]|nr:hypothetical protein [Planctomycetota bacterium]